MPAHRLTGYSEECINRQKSPGSGCTAGHTDPGFPLSHPGSIIILTSLMLGMLVKKFSGQQSEVFFLFFLENRL